MVKITGIRHCTNAKDEEFICFILHGDIDLVQSKETGRWYATASKTSISCTFDEQTAKGMIGKELPGTIDKVSVDPYDYTVPETGEVIKLTHKYEFNPENKTVEEEVFM